MNENEFDTQYKPLESPGQEEGSHFWTRKEVLDALAAGTITEQQVWTVVEDGEGGLCVMAGWAAVNRVSHQVTEVPWVDGLETVDLDDFEEDDEEQDGAPCCPDPGCGGSPCTFPGYADNH